MKNENCLRGVMCPECGQTERFFVSVSTFARVSDDGVEEYCGDTEWNDGSFIRCGNGGCFISGKVDDFTLPSFRVTFETYTPHSLDMGDADRRGWWMPGEWLFDERPEEMAFEFDPEGDYDPEEHGSVQDAIVEWAVETLKREGAIHPSDSPCDDARWWSTEDETTSFETGETMVKSFHFEGFHLDTQRLINKELSQ